ncbi:2-amino-thiazoline-4-carboxylic acid hydrolase (plasmid) [Paroceanicella profunda]|uniref:2-amino-thiazoline-4-carboxylic acid hydrolase n=1 Tax=Paroceanicella profunda TaxID=2579971 RepID=A0A5B8G3L5_9RHOB|nr:L-2-amino-thiazoline-4-carboxylic acid hydrolase [Paroceanicella profunda]QDL93979.1 2-amino-thiazoline-4-carboxylic acid hydrolase [Paroceanicella profunda]
MPQDDQPAAPRQMPILERRRIEALVLREVHDVIRERSGPEEAAAVLGTAVSRAAIAHGAEMAAGTRPDLADFRAILPLWTMDGALEIDVLEESPERLSFNVTRCRYAELYRSLGLGHIGHLLSCNRDGDFCTGYNPDITLTRSQTIMQGASHCDFRYAMTPEQG